MNRDKAGTVLIVEDNTELGALYREWLSGHYHVKVANTKEEALSIFNESIDIAILDRRLPRSSGDEVLREIRSSAVECQVAMVSGVDPDFDIIELGFDEYLTKPVDAEALTELVDRLFDRRNYSKKLRRLQSLVEKRALLESEKPQSELEMNEQYESLVTDIEELQTELKSTQTNLDDTEVSSETFWRTILAP